MKKDKEELIKKIAERVDALGGEIYYVGGCVRDSVMGLESIDTDIEIHQLSYNEVKSILEDSCQYSEVGKSFGIFSINGFNTDIALPRKETETGRGHKDLSVEIDPFLGTYKAAYRRDFTINALMQNIITGEILDYFNAYNDIENKVIRHINTEAFSQDPLRILRAAQFASRFSFDIAPETISLAKEADLCLLSRERVEEETKKAFLKSNKPSEYFRFIKEMNQLSHWFFELNSDIFDVTMESLDRAALVKADNQFPFLLASLVSSFKKEEDVVNFITRLTNEKDLKQYVLKMYRLTKKLFSNLTSHKSQFELYCVYDECRNPEELLNLAIALYRPDTDKTNILKNALEEYLSIIDKPSVTGKDLLEYGMKEGKPFSELLKKAHMLKLQGLSKENIIQILFS